jgi:hypothetical protein
MLKSVMDRIVRESSRNSKFRIQSDWSSTMKKVCKSLVLAAAITFTLISPTMLAAHCDTMAGPVIGDAKIALETATVTPVLKWVKPAHEPELRALFALTLKVREQSPEARDLADRYFFETLVRLHREGEGAPYTGLKPAEAAEPLIIETDKMLTAGVLGEPMKMLQQEIAEGIRQRFARALEARKHAADSVLAGREYVEAYIDFTHYIEALHTIAKGEPHHPENSASEHAH